MQDINGKISIINFVFFNLTCFFAHSLSLVQSLVICFTPVNTFHHTILCIGSIAVCEEMHKEHISSFLLFFIIILYTVKSCSELEITAVLCDKYMNNMTQEFVCTFNIEIQFRNNLWQTYYVSAEQLSGLCIKMPVEKKMKKN